MPCSPCMHMHVCRLQPCLPFSSSSLCAQEVGSRARSQKNAKVRPVREGKMSLLPSPAKKEATENRQKDLFYWRMHGVHLSCMKKPPSYRLWPVLFDSKNWPLISRQIIFVVICGRPFWMSQRDVSMILRRSAVQSRFTITTLAVRLIELLLSPICGVTSKVNPAQRRV